MIGYLSVLAEPPPIPLVKVAVVNDMPVRCSLTHLMPALQAPSRFGAGAVSGRMLSSASLYIGMTSPPTIAQNRSPVPMAKSILV